LSSGCSPCPAGYDECNTCGGTIFNSSSCATSLVFLSHQTVIFIPHSLPPHHQPSYVNTMAEQIVFNPLQPNRTTSFTSKQGPPYTPPSRISIQHTPTPTRVQALLLAFKEHPISNCKRLRMCSHSFSTICN